MVTSEKNSRIAMAADIVEAYVSFNSIRASELPELIDSVHAALEKLGTENATTQPEQPVPAVSIRKSLTPGFLICLDDGKRFRSLKRHLASLGMTPDQYRQKWNLPGDYPMVAPEYAAARSALAKQIGLGRPAKDAAKAKSGANLQPVEEGTPPQQGSANDPN